MQTDNKFYENNEYVLFKSGYPSQWYPSEFIIDNKTYVNCEQYMMEQKALLFNDYEIAKQIMIETDPKIHKELGRKVANFDADKWNEIADEVVFKANYAKYSQNPMLYEKLIESGNKKYVECAPYDKIWGNGLDNNNTLQTPEEDWKGTNRLGKVIMRLRNELKLNNL